jgi:hypothetical protein
MLITQLPNFAHRVTLIAKLKSKTLKSQDDKINSSFILKARTLGNLAENYRYD